MKGLVIRSPWIELILSGKKTWEMRTRRTNLRGLIALIRGGSGTVVGTAVLLDSLPALSEQQMRESTRFHGIPADQIPDAMQQGWTTPWVLGSVKRFERPVPYAHPNGAVTWVDLPELAGAGSGRSNDLPSVEAGVATSFAHRLDPDTSTRRWPDSRLARPADSAWADIPLTAGNIRNGHIYLRSAERLLPADCIGGSNKSSPGKSIKVHFRGGDTIDTDVSGDKMILRARGPVQVFFRNTRAQAGDTVRFARRAPREFDVTLVRPNGAE